MMFHEVLSIYVSSQICFIPSFEALLVLMLVVLLVVDCDVEVVLLELLVAVLLVELMV